MLKKNKRGNVEVRILERFIEFILPVFMFVVVLYIVWSLGTDKIVYSYFQSVEFSNIIDAAAGFDGQIRIKYIPKKPDFNITFTPTSLGIFTPGTKTPLSKTIHIPEGYYIVNELPRQGALPTKLVQFLKTEKAFSVVGWNTPNLAANILLKDQILCRVDWMSDETKYVEINDPLVQQRKPASKNNKLDTLPKIFLDDATIDYFGIDTDVRLTNVLSAKNIVKTSAEADIILKVNMIDSKYASAIISHTPDDISTYFACQLANAFAASENSPSNTKNLADKSSLSSVLVPSSVINPDSSGSKKIVQLDLYHIIPTGDSSQAGTFSDPYVFAKYGYLKALGKIVVKANEAMS